MKPTMTQPLVSVLIPVYNGAADVGAAIDSALAQRGCRVEVVVVDDGSTDATPQILAGYGDRIRAVRQNNRGAKQLAGTRNHTATLARGDWLAFLDHDDLWQPDKLQRQLEVAEQNSADVVYTNAQNFGAVERVAALRSDPATMPEGDLLEPLLRDNFLVMSSVLMKRSLFEAVGGFTETPEVSEDWDLWLKAAAAGAKFAAIGDPLTLYRWRPGSFSRDYRRVRELRLRTIERALQTERAQQLSWAARRKALAGVESCSAWFLAESHPRQALPWYARSLWYWPFDANCWKGVVKSCLGRS
jgi:glycosyltransferase involved in cell wall biosynthesis